MYINRPVIVQLNGHFNNNYHTQNHDYLPSANFGTRWAIMNLPEARELMRRAKSEAKKNARICWYRKYKSMYGCLMCGQRNPDALVFHHLGDDCTAMLKTDRLANMITNQVALPKIEVEISKCAVLCQNCHEIAHKSSKEVLEEIYEKNERTYGPRKPGSDCKETRALRKLFRKEKDDVAAKIVGSINQDFLDGHDKEVQLEQEQMAEAEYLKKREEAMDLERMRYDDFLDEWIAKGKMVKSVRLPP